MESQRWTSTEYRETTKQENNKNSMPYIIDEPLVNEDNQERKFKTIRRGLIGNIKND